MAINHDDKMPIDVAADSDIKYVLQQRMTEAGNQNTGYMTYRSIICIPAGYTDDVLGYIRASMAKTMLADLKDSVRSNRSLDIKDKYGSTAVSTKLLLQHAIILPYRRMWRLPMATWMF